MYLEIITKMYIRENKKEKKNNNNDIMIIIYMTKTRKCFIKTLHVTCKVRHLNLCIEHIIFIYFKGIEYKQAKTF